MKPFCLAAVTKNNNKEWAAMYADLPSRQAKTAVKDRLVITCSPDETRALSPDGLQAGLDAAMADTPSGR